LVFARGVETMAIYSMTGYASTLWPPAALDPASGSGRGPDGSALALEMRSVNGRFLDIAFRMPDEYRGLEPALRELIGGSLRRGKVEFKLVTRTGGDAADDQPTSALLARLAEAQRVVLQALPDARPVSVHEALQWCRQGGATELPGEAVVMESARQCLQALRASREREGARLGAMLLERVQTLRELAAKAAPLVPQAVQRMQARFVERWHEALTLAGLAGAAPGPTGSDSAPSRSAATGTPTVPEAAAQDRALQEAAAYALRIDVAEELSRLQVHLDETERLLEQGGELGKRLDFLIQELHREANTLGSKAATRELGTISMDMRVLIEQMREQVQNIE
jgi:uncharacterized protein (TIGR00255 family)